MYAVGTQLINTRLNDSTIDNKVSVQERQV